MFNLSEIIVDRFPLLLFSCILLSFPAGLNQLDANNEWHFAKALFVIAFVESISISTIFCVVDKLLKGFAKWPCIIVLLLMSEIELFIFLNFGTRMSSMIMSFVLQTNGSETKEFIQTFLYSKNTLYVLLMALMFMVFYYYTDKYWKAKFSKRFTTFLCVKKNIHVLFSLSFCLIFIFSLSMLVKISYYNQSKVIPPAYTTIQAYIVSMNAVGNHSKEISNINDAIKHVSIDSCCYDSPIIVLIIGESYNKYHSNLYGYNLNVCPNLIKEKKKGNLFVFNNALSPMPSTDYVLKYFYSTKSVCDDRSDWSQNPLFPAIFKKAGYDVRLFDNQCTQTKGDINLDYQCSYFLNPNEISKKCFDYRNMEISEFDGDFIESNKVHFSRNAHQLTIIHLMGQHFTADLRYPHVSKFNIFNASNIGRKELCESQRQQVAYYDNATLYNDYVIKQIIDFFRDKNSIIIYFSDHGEQIYDDKRKVFGRNFSKNQSNESIKCLNEIPFMIWCSDQYMAMHSKIVSRINQSLNRPLMNDDICYLLFDLAGMKFKGTKPDRSVINDAYNINRHRIINEMYDYDAHFKDIKSSKLLVEK